MFQRPTYAQWLAGIFGPGKVQKLTLNLGFPCPNRDGSLGRGGCIYCNNSAFSPTLDAAPKADIEAQLEASRRFFARKYPTMRYLAYFQTYTSTNAGIDALCELYLRALVCPGVAGLVVATRPDAMPDALLGRLADINRSIAPVIIEYGAESFHDATLLAINRCHSAAATIDAVERTRRAGIPVGIHLIFGLPGEDSQAMLASVDTLNTLPVDTVKFHQLQIVKGTTLARRFIDAGGLDDPEHACRELGIINWSADAYMDFCCSVLSRLRHDIVVDRFVSQSPDSLLIHPRWGLKNHVFTDRMQAKLREA